MLSNTYKRNQKGFTIIEVLIVLAIAGLILLVVFLAVPALQRNARNTTRKSDVASLLAGVSEYVNNNDGTTPANQANMGAATSNTATIGTAGNTVDVKLGSFKAGDISSTSTVATGNPNDVNKVTIVYGGKCGTGASLGDSVAGGPSRGFVALYTLEPSSKLCQAS